MRRITTVVLLILATSGIASQAIAATGEPGSNPDMTHNSTEMTHNSLDMTYNSLDMTYD